MKGRRRRAHLQRGVPELGEGGLGAERAQVVQQRLDQQAHRQAQGAVRAAQAPAAARANGHCQVAHQRNDDLGARGTRNLNLKASGFSMRRLGIAHCHRQVAKLGMMTWAPKMQTPPQTI